LPPPLPSPPHPLPPPPPTTTTDHIDYGTDYVSYISPRFLSFNPADMAICAFELASRPVCTSDIAHTAAVVFTLVYTQTPGTRVNTCVTVLWACGPELGLRLPLPKRVTLPDPTTEKDVPYYRKGCTLLLKTPLESSTK
jgi:hypothetical protein